MKNKLAFIAAALLSVQCFATGSAYASCSTAGQCTKNLTLNGLCSPSFGTTDVWQLNNLATTGPNANDNGGCAGLHYTALIPGSSYSSYGCVLTNSSVTITAPVGGANKLEVYIDGQLLVSAPAQAQCDCSGTPAGTATVNACGICNGGTQGIGCDSQCDTKTVDACGICGGDGAACACTQQVASTSTVKAATTVNAKVKTLYKRIPQFAGRAVKCDHTYASKVPAWEKKGQNYVTKIEGLLATNITASTLSCPGAQCVSTSTVGTSKAINSNIKSLGTLARNVKLAAIKACKVPKRNEAHDPLAKDTAYYINLALTSVKGLPATTTQCTKK